jgi:phosphohistidine phosphatase SixA
MRRFPIRRQGDRLRGTGRSGRALLVSLVYSCLLWASCGGAAASPTVASPAASDPAVEAGPTDPAGPPAVAVPPGLIGQVAAGGYVLYFRHTARDSSLISTGDLAVADNAAQCLPGSELTSAGISDATGIGQAFRRYGITVDHVYASPTCRTVQMADLAFGPGSETRRELSWPGMWTAAEKATLTPKLRALLGTAPPAGGNIVLLSHNDVLTEDRIGITVTLGQGDAAVFRPAGDGSFELIGRINLQEWLQ